MAGKPVYKDDGNTLYVSSGDPEGTNGLNYVASGNGVGQPIGGYGFRAHCTELWNAPDGGPCFFRPITVACSEENPHASDYRSNCFGGFESDGKIKPRDDQCCKDAVFDDLGVQSGGCISQSCSFHTNFLLNMEMGLYYNITVDDYERPHGCNGMEGNVTEWRNPPSWGSPALHCNKTDYAPENVVVSDIIDAFANDHDIWADAFLDAWPRMQHNGYAEGELLDGPQSSWLGYASLLGI